jgi:DNA-binding NarL/FixJ family response regulator
MDAQSILIADPDPALWHELSPPLGSWLPNKRLDFCTTRREALDRVVDPFYDVVISSASFAEAHNFCLVKSLKCLSVPLIITTMRSTVSSSRRALKEGAFGLICSPVDAKLAPQTVVLATWVSDILRRITAYRESMHSYRAHLDRFPPDAELETLLERCNVIFETTYMIHAKKQSETSRTVCNIWSVPWLHWKAKRECMRMLSFANSMPRVPSLKDQTPLP